VGVGNICRGYGRGTRCYVLLLFLSWLQDAVRKEARRAFALNVDVYGEEGGLYADAARGVANVVTGYVSFRVRGARGVV